MEKKPIGKKLIGRRIKKSLIAALTAALVLTMIPFSAFAEGETQVANDGQQTRAKRTILLYDCGSDLETEAGLASFNLRQILNARFSEDDDVRFIVMTGGADKWHLEKDKLVFPDDVYVPKDAVCVTGSDVILDPDDPSTYSDDPKSQISNTYNQIWEAKGIDAVDQNGDPDPNAGKMVLVDGDGVMGDGANAKRSIADVSGYTEEDGDLYFDLDKEDNYEWMNDPEVLKAFINYGAENYPAERYDLILWDHGGGTDGGFCSDLHESSHGLDMMWIDSIADALRDNKVIDSNGDGKQDGRFDFVNFDACLMNSVEIDLLLSDLTHYYIASPETEPGYGQDYTGWLDMAGQDPDVDTFELGKKIVDDFTAFYDKESGTGSNQDGTLAVIDMEKLMTKTVKTAGSDSPRGFVDALNELNHNLRNEIVWEGLYYDEFRSFRDSIRYGSLEYFDLGNLVSQLSYVFDEVDYEDLVDGGINDRNSYSDTADVIMQILNDPEIIYARGTKNIHTKEQFYRDAQGNVTRGTQGTSGIYICFDPLNVPGMPGSHHMFIKEAIKKMDPKDPKTQFLRDIDLTMMMYGLAYRTGTVVTDMVSSGAAKDEIDYDAVKDYWENNTDKWGDMQWENYILPVMKEIDGGEASAREWLEPIIRQQRDEAVVKDQITVKPFSKKSGEGWTVTMNDVRKQAIDCVTMNVYAELPAAKAFLEDPEHAEYQEEVEDMSTDLQMGSISGEEIFDVDPAKQGYEKAIDWLFDPTSKWDLSEPSDEWYALKDGSGSIHVAVPFVNGDEIEIPTGYFTTEMQESYGTVEPHEVLHKVGLVFKKDKKGAWRFTDIDIEQENGWRTIPVSEYKGSMELTTLIEISDDWSTVYLPAGRRSFKLTSKNKNDFTVKFMDVSKIPDIADTDGDGRIMHRTVTVNNIYGHRLDITDLVEKSGGKANTLSVKGRTVSIRQSKLRKKAQQIKASKALRFASKGQGTISYKLVSAAKGGNSFKKYFKVDAKTGRITIKKNRRMKKGSYKLKLKVRAAGNIAYKAKTKTVSFTIRVK